MQILITFYRAKAAVSAIIVEAVLNLLPGGLPAMLRKAMQAGVINSKR